MTTPRRVVVACFAYQQSAQEKVQDYVNFLAARGVQVDLIVNDEGWAEFVDPGVTVYTFRHREDRRFTRRLERLVVFKLPGWTLVKTARVGEAVGMKRAAARSLPVAQQIHSRLGHAVHRRMYLPAYRLVRPNILYQIARKELANFDLTGVERIVAADAYATKVVWALAQRAPDAIATTALDRAPYQTAEDVD